MRLGGRLSAAIEIVQALERQRRPVALVLKDWGNANRYAGSGDRAAIGNLVHDVLRKKRSLAAVIGDDSPRALVMAAAASMPGYPADDLLDFGDDRFAPEPLSLAEKSAIATGIPVDTLPAAQADIPDWLWPSFDRVFGERAIDEGRGLAARAPLDLRLNPFRSEPPRVDTALKRFRSETDPAFPLLRRIPAGDGFARAPHIASDATFQKGWVEVQDAGSQLAAEIAVGDAKPRTVLDLCAGAGGKTLALSVFMGGRGQVFAHDIDRRRMTDLWPRVKRAGAHNVQVVEPEALKTHDVAAKGFNLVVVDAPCTGTGTWRRHPDTKWRMAESALPKRMAEQAEVLAQAATLVKPGGRLAYITCSVLAEENEDQLAALLQARPDLSPIPQNALLNSLRRDARPATLPSIAVGSYAEGELGLRLTPHTSGTDGFFIGCLSRVAH